MYTFCQNSPFKTYAFYTVENTIPQNHKLGHRPIAVLSDSNGNEGKRREIKFFSLYLGKCQEGPPSSQKEVWRVFSSWRPYVRSKIYYLRTKVEKRVVGQPQI